MPMYQVNKNKMKLKDGYLLRTIADEWVVVPVGNTVYDFNGIMTLNETGSCLWKKLENDCTLDELTDAVTGEYDVGREIAEADIKEFIDLLFANKLLEL